MHKLIERQIRLFLGKVDLQKIPREWMMFLRAVSDTYTHADQDRELSLRSLELSSAEFAKLNEQLSREKKIVEQKVQEQTKEIKRAYEVEKRARIELEELEKTKDQFILTTQHYLRTPMTIVKGYLQYVLANKAEPLGKANKVYLLKAEEATERMSSLVNEFLNISQMEVGKNILNRENVNIRELVEDIFKELEAEISKRNLRVEFNISSEISLNIDKKKIREALVNLIDNAVKYNRENGLVSVSAGVIKHPIEKERDLLKLIITDTGIGITADELPQLFNQYFQRGKVAKQFYTTGRGIGLAVTKNVIQAHGGKIYAESEGRDKGARFVIELPAA